MKKCVLGILAHVDAGKTTLTEAMLYEAGVLSRLGRVDRRDAYLDTHSLERERGITIFSKQARLDFGGTAVTLIDTPGHIDFSCEAERALSVEDYAVLIISAPDGVTAHTKTLWHLLSARRIPTFIFVNKTDISDRRRDAVLAEIKTLLSGGAVDFTRDDTPEFYEECAGRDEELMEEYFSAERLESARIAEAVAKRKIFPCLFGSALKNSGVRELLSALDKYILEKRYSDSIFGAKVYKIGRDPSGRRLTYMKLTGGSLKNKDSILYVRDGRQISEKVEEIRIYSGDKYKNVQEAAAGTVCAILGPSMTFAGQGLGSECNDEAELVPVLDYRMILPEGASPYESYMRLMELTEEDPSLGMSYDNRTHEIRVRLMGEIQTEVLSRMILDRYGLLVGFDEGEVLYKETVSGSVNCSGHFEPLRHYAEVHLRIEPMPEGTGVVSATECPTDTLALNWQRLILTHIEERVHRGILTASPLTDVKITLVAGRAHLKHTEGGDFRQATYRAVRQGLMKDGCVLLEPTFDFKMELPEAMLGRAMTDITNMHGETDAPEFSEGIATLTGSCPVYTMRSYPTELRAYTRGEGRIYLSVGAYKPCHNAEAVIAARGYNAECDERNPLGSVFCKGGAGYSVPWNEADALMHIKPFGDEHGEDTRECEPIRPKVQSYHGTLEEDKELMRIFEATYGRVKRRSSPERVENKAPSEAKPDRPKKAKPRGDNFVIIDGYNFIFANESLRKAAEKDFSYARDLLVRMMCDYSAYHRSRAIVVFDAYKREGGEGSEEIIGPVSVVYTKEGQTADAFIERTTYDMAKEHTVRVVTSDREEQQIVLGSGGLRVGTREFSDELENTVALIRAVIN